MIYLRGAHELLALDLLDEAQLPLVFDQSNLAEGSQLCQGTVNLHDLAGTQYFERTIKR